MLAKKMSGLQYIFLTQIYFGIPKIFKTNV